jgi:hypothetical protein
MHPSFHFLLTGDESWMFCEYDRETLWAASWEEVDELRGDASAQKGDNDCVFHRYSGIF